MVAERRDLRTKSLAERLAPGAAPEVVVAACASWLANDLQVTGSGCELEHRLAQLVVEPLHQAAVRASRVQLLERKLQTAQVLLLRRRDDVQPISQLVASLDDTTERTDHDVRDAMSVEGAEHLDGVEQLRHQRPRAFSIDCSRCCGDRSSAVASRASRCSSAAYGTSDASMSK